MEIFFVTLGYAVIVLTLAGFAYTVVRIFTKLNDDDNDD